MRITITPVNIALNTTSNKIIIYTSGCIAGGSSGGGTWGSITGTLSAQTDLQNALNAKANANNVLAKDNTTAFTPDSDYEPSTKKYVDDIAITKVDKVTGKQLSTEDYTTAEKNKLTGIEAGAQVNVIETVKVNNIALIPTLKAVDIPVPTKLTATITIAVSDWAGGTTCVKTVSGLLTTDHVTPAMDRANLALYAAADITGELEDGQIVFTAAQTPTEDIVINLNIVR